MRGSIKGPPWISALNIPETDLERLDNEGFAAVTGSILDDSVRSVGAYNRMREYLVLRSIPPALQHCKQTNDISVSVGFTATQKQLLFY